MKRVYNKMVRDKIAVIIRDAGMKPVIDTVSDTEAIQLLAKKLLEESAEFNENICVEELVDLQEVIDALKKKMHISEEEFKRVKQAKLDVRGGYELNVFLKYVE